MLPFGEYKPDLSNFNGQTTQLALNVVPRADGYGPWKALTPVTASLPAASRGTFYARKTDGTIVVFAGTRRDLQARQHHAGLDRRVQGRPRLFGAAVDGSLGVRAIRQPRHRGASQHRTAGIRHLLGSAFADLGGSPPQVRYAAVVGRFLVLSGLLSTPYRIQWSGLNAITTWTPGVNSSDFQDFPDGGVVRGVAGGEFGVIFQDSVIRRMVYAVGASYVFKIDRIAEDKGLLAPYSLIRAGDKIFFLANQGFHGMLATGVPEPIGKEKFDRTFFGDYDPAQLQQIIGASDPENSRVFWAYKSKAGQAGLFDKLICYDYVLNRAAVISQTGEFLSTLASPGLTLDGLDAISTNIETITFSFDDVALSALPKIAIVDGNHKLGFASGANVEATIETAEQTLDGRRVRVKGLRPITDAATCYGAIGARENTQSTVTYSAEQVVNSKGLCPANVSTRLARARMRIPAGVAWSFANGFEPVGQEGRR